MMMIVMVTAYAFAGSTHGHVAVEASRLGDVSDGGGAGVARGDVDHVNVADLARLNRSLEAAERGVEPGAATDGES
jgi:hypothetical protein